MIFIAHRGLIDGPHTKQENNPTVIEHTVSIGYQVELDVRFYKGDWWLGHDKPQYRVTYEWLYLLRESLWIHCKDIEALIQMREYGDTFHYFWHEKDTLTLTSRNFVWAYPGTQPIYRSIAVLPELNGDDCSQCLGVCTDYADLYKAEYYKACARQ